MVNKRETKCTVCKSTRGVIRKYHMQICRRCFKERARKMGFEKYN